MGVTGDLIILELTIEIMILGLILYFLIANRKGRWKKDANALKARISEADEILIKVDQELNERCRELKGLLVKLQRKEEALIKWMEMAGKAMQGFQESANSASRENPRGLNYEKVIGLMEKGVSEKEISRITGVGEGEIDLILKLKRNE